MGLSHWNLGSFDQALSLYMKALKYFENNEKAQGYLANTYNNIGLIYGDKKEYNKARPYFEKAIALTQSNNDSFNLAAYYNNMGNASRDAGNSEEALDWFGRSHQIHLALNNAYGMGMAWYNIAGVYQETERYGLAQEAGLKSLEAREMAGDRMGIALAHNLLSANYQNLNKLSEAIFHSDEALKLAEELGSNTLLHRVYRNRWLLLKDANRVADALEAHILFKQYSDSLNVADADKRLREVEVRYEVDKKDREIALGQASLKQKELVLLRRNQLIATLVVVLVLLIALGLVLRSRYRYKQQQQLAAANLQMQQAQIKAVISAQEAEKTRFAQDLHDGIGQLLTALKLSFNQTAAAEIGKSLLLIDELYREMRHLAYNIMPQTLLKKGLDKALDELVQRLNQSQQQITFELNSYGLEQRLPLESEQLLYRVIQEWLTNVMKYAQSSRVVLNLVASDGRLSLMIEDNGQGFDASVLGRSKGHGWANIESRLGVLGASYELDSRAGRQGTTLNIELSLTHQVM
jgi:signal transduction histidine kinase